MRALSTWWPLMLGQDQASPQLLPSAGAFTSCLHLYRPISSGLFSPLSESELMGWSAYPSPLEPPHWRPSPPPLSPGAGSHDAGSHTYLLYDPGPVSEPPGIWLLTSQDTCSQSPSHRAELREARAGGQGAEVTLTQVTGFPKLLTMVALARLKLWALSPSQCPPP